MGERVSALDGFYTTWNNARNTFGEGTPQAGSQIDASATLDQLGTDVKSAKPGGGWTGSGSDAYDTSNTRHGAKLTKLADLDRRLAAQMDRAGDVVTTGRTNLDAVRQWVTDAANSVPPGAQRDAMLLKIAKQGLGQLSDIVQTSNETNNAIGDEISRLTKEYGEDGEPEDDDDPRFGTDPENPEEEDKPNGKEDGEALAEQADTPSAYRDPAVYDRVAANFPEGGLTQEQMDQLARGEEVDGVPKETQEYYREFYQAAGKDGLLNLDRHLEAKEAAGDAAAGAQRDRLANGLTIASNENIVERNPDGTIAHRGGYENLPPDLREMLAARVADDTYPGQPEMLPVDAKNQHIADVVQFSELMGEANPGYQPGTRLGTEMYLKSADMIEHAVGGSGPSDTPREAYERAANTMSEVAGRNNEASYQIWSGDGDDLPDGYNREETVRTLLGHDWTRSGTEGEGAATLLDWMTEDSQRPVGDPIGDRAREALIEVPDMVSPTDDPGVQEQMRNAFAHNDAVSTEMAQLLANNTGALSAEGQPYGFPETKMGSAGSPMLGADDGNRLLQLGSYSEEGRVTLATAAETMRIDELAADMREHPDPNNKADLQSDYANSTAGALSGRIDDAMTNAINDKNAIIGEEVTNPQDGVTRAKMAGAEIAGWATNELVGKIPGSGEVTGITGVDPGQIVEDKIKDFIGKPEYQGTPVPSGDDLQARATVQAQQSALEAAFKAGQLPPQFTPGGTPIDVSSMDPESDEYKAVQDWMEKRGLTQYVENYGQSYGVAKG